MGFTFENEPGASAHIEFLEDRYRTKKWMLYHLYHAGLRGDQLFRDYVCYIRSILEYCPPVYHPVLTGGQEEQLECLHCHAIQICYGHNAKVDSSCNTRPLRRSKRGGSGGPTTSSGRLRQTRGLGLDSHQGTVNTVISELVGPSRKLGLLRCSASTPH